MEYCKNKYGISVKKWCVTCHHGDNCKRREYNIGMDKNCWTMKDAYQNAGKGDGRVRKLIVIGGEFKFID